MSPDQTRFQQTMDALNRMMEYKSMPLELRYKLRGYFLQARELHMSSNYTGLLNQMSPVLQAEVAHATNRRWLVKVWYLGVCSDEFAAQVAQHMVASMFCPEEVMYIKDPKLCIVSRGLVGRFGRVIRKGGVYGEDFILTNEQLRMDVAAIAITYAEIMSIGQKSFLTLVQQASQFDAGEVRMGFIQLAVMRGVLRLAHILREDEKLRCSFLDGKVTLDAEGNAVEQNGSSAPDALTAAQDAQSVPSTPRLSSRHSSPPRHSEMQTISQKINALEVRINERIKDHSQEHQKSVKVLEAKLDYITSILQKQASSSGVPDTPNGPQAITLNERTAVNGQSWRDL
eukprot:gnl/MRDRNA2_/MRDRNA2_180598_c0_seq1.p1 gnl/MRDRNA2_/MRDRNA2_180598_c0~~gnl/MRDRNA2_/MRDRNA2_180598_c0_seq1.p1  ORF type:complete len:378 (+),score=59.81 gnl/MRDRNA2_/MRDRNA2_180598_c0_seq1:111-1136(+)